MRYSLIPIVCDGDLNMFRQNFSLQDCIDAYDTQTHMKEVKLYKMLMNRLDKENDDFDALKFSHELFEDKNNYHAVSNITHLEEVMNTLRYMNCSYELNYIHHPNHNYYLIRVLEVLINEQH